MLVRPRRTATIRTRLDARTVMERLSALVTAPPPEGLDRFLAHATIVQMAGKSYRLRQRASTGDD